MKRRSRLARKQKTRNARRAIVFIVLTLILALILVFVGIPLLIRLAIFLGDLRSSSILPEKGDTIPPSPPRIVLPFEATNSAQISLKGYAESGTTVKIYSSGTAEIEVIVDNDGQFKVKDFKLTSGRNEITAVAKDEAGNESQSSIPTVIEYDTSPPDLEIINPEEGTTISGLENKIKIEGKTDVETRLAINNRLVIVDPEGKFSYSYSLKEGENSFNIIVWDKAGNQTEKELKVNYSP